MFEDEVCADAAGAKHARRRNTEKSFTE